jgi:hypothetical protein
VKGVGEFEFKRCASRLIEMQAEDYMAEPHKHLSETKKHINHTLKHDIVADFLA